jgi:hypothetical protein
MRPSVIHVELKPFENRFLKLTSMPSYCDSPRFETNVFRAN